LVFIGVLREVSKKNLNYAWFNTQNLLDSSLVMARAVSKVCTTSLDSLTNMIYTYAKEWVAPESKKIEALIPSIGTVPVTTSDPPSVSPGIGT
jgi:hypothetical protein